MINDDILFSKFSGPACIFRYDNGRITMLNVNDKYFSELQINIDVNEYLRMNPLDTFDKGYEAMYIDAIERCIANDEETTCETWRKITFSCCGDEVIYVKSRFALIDKSDGVCTIYEAIRNTTAERKNLDTLQESERRFKIASDQINIYYWEYTVATKEMRPCFRCMRDLGLPAIVYNYPEPAIEMGIFPPDYADMYRDWHRQIAAGVKELEAEIPLTVGRVPFRVRYTTEFDDDGRPVKAYGSATLISAAELDRIRLDDSIIQNLADAYNCICLADIEHDRIKILKQDENIRKGIFDDESFSENAKKIITIFREEYGESMEQYADLDYLREDLFKGSEFRELNFKNNITGQWARVVFEAVENVGDSITKILITYSIIDDLRAQKLDADRLIASQKEELEKKQEELIAAVAEANRANRAKSDFLARMSHEIRTPMNAIMGMNEIILKSASDDTIKGYAADAYRAATGLLGTINEILDFSRIESGKVELIEEEFRQDYFFSNLYSMFALRAEDKNLALIFDIDRKLPKSVVADEIHIRQVLHNLLSNAVKYTEHGRISLAVSLLDRNDEYAAVRYEVSDTGQGIRPEDMESLFKAFERIDEKNNRSIEGTGLGMNIAKGLLKLMDSKLDVESTFGKGSTFAFTLRLKINEYEELGDYRSSLGEAPVQEKRPLYVNSGRSVLVVDDNAINLKVITVLLKETQMKVVPVLSGEDALRASLHRKFDIIFLDHYMPGMDGIETLKRLKAQEGGLNTETPVIALTANAIKGASEEYRSYGFDDTVFKPATQNEINEVLWKYLG